MDSIIAPDRELENTDQLLPLPGAGLLMNPFFKPKKKKKKKKR